MGSDLIFRKKLFPRILCLFPDPPPPTTTKSLPVRKAVEKTNQAQTRRGVCWLACQPCKVWEQCINPTCPSLSKPLSASCHEKGQKMRDPFMTQVGAASVFGKELGLAWEPSGRVAECEPLGEPVPELLFLLDSCSVPCITQFSWLCSQG